MFKNYLKITIRNLIKYKAYTFINILGLAVGISCCILILLYVQDELSYDRFHKNADRVWRVTSEETQEGNKRKLANTYAPLAPNLLADNPDIIHAVRFFPKSVMVNYGAAKRFQEDRFLFCDSTVFAVFSFPLLQGDPESALKAPNSVVITEETAHKYFGAENPLGKILRVENRFDFTVTGVLQNIPRNAHFKFDFLATLSSIGDIMGSWVFNSHKSWYWPPMYTYLLLPPEYPVEKIASRFPELIRKNIGAWAVSQRAFHLQPLTDIYLHSHLENEIEPTSSITYIYIFSLVALFILLIACINFINLATARSANRAKEVGLRKVVGAGHLQLIKQFLGESLFYAVLALLLAIALIEFFLPVFNDLVGKHLDVKYIENWSVWGGLAAITLFVGLVAGSYPAFFLARFRPIQVLHGKTLPGNGGRTTLRLRSVLVVSQFIISIALIILTAGIHRQLQFIQTERLGVNKEHLVVIPVRDENVQQNFEALKNGILAQTGMVDATAISNLPWEQGYYDFPVRAEGMADDANLNMSTLVVDPDFTRTFGIEIVQGRGFSKEFSTDAREAFILNETAVKKLGWDSAAGKKFEIHNVSEGGAKAGRVIGVMKDFHLRSLHHEIEPLVLVVSPASYYLDNLVVRISGRNVAAEISALQGKWNELVPNRPFEYFFLDDAFDKLYRSEQKLGGLFDYFAGLAIFVGCLGLLGLAAFAAEQRTKEIGIRKVLGATVANVVTLLSKDFVKLVLLANVIAWPLAWWAMNRWLENFAYRIDISWWFFALAGGLALVIALLTVSTQAIRAALANPVESLRYE